MIQTQIKSQIYQLRLQNQRLKLDRRAHLHRRSLRNAQKQVVLVRSKSEWWSRGPQLTVEI